MQIHKVYKGESGGSTMAKKQVKEIKVICQYAEHDPERDEKIIKDLAKFFAIKIKQGIKNQ